MHRRQRSETHNIKITAHMRKHFIYCLIWRCLSSFLLKSFRRDLPKIYAQVLRADAYCEFPVSIQLSLSAPDRMKF